MKWFYFIDLRGVKHYADTREEAEKRREQLGGGYVIVETSSRPGLESTNTSSPAINAAICGSPGASALTQVLNTDTSWLRREGELIYGQNKLVPALQIYHPTRSDLHCEADRRLLRLKNASLPEIAHYAAALKTVLPRNQNILLCCAPGSTPTSNSGIAEIIKRISGGILIDGSSVLRTKAERNRKSTGARFDDNELASTISVNIVSTPPSTRILLIDDVVTSGQTMRICVSILKSAYPSCKVSCLAISSTDYESSAVGIADTLEVPSISEALKPLHARIPVQPTAGNQLAPASRTERYGANARVTRSSLETNTQQRREASSSNANQKPNTSGSSSDCFVITAIYEGDRDHPNVLRLQRLRDDRIAVLPGGALIIQCYKWLGPALAVFVLKSGLSRPMRSILDYCLKDEGRNR